jgi:IS5 family transposase
MFGYKNHVGIDRAHGLIRTWDASAANAHDGARLPELISKRNTASGVWADTAYRSKKNETFLERGMPRRPLPEHIARANAKRSAVRSAVEHVFAGQKHRMGLFIRTIGIARARIKIGMANLAYNFQRLRMARGARCARIAGKRGAERRFGPETHGNEAEKADPHAPKAAIRTLAPLSVRDSRFFEVSSCR